MCRRSVHFLTPELLAFTLKFEIKMIDSPYLNEFNYIDRLL